MTETATSSHGVNYQVGQTITEEQMLDLPVGAVVHRSVGVYTRTEGGVTRTSSSYPDSGVTTWTDESWREGNQWVTSRHTAVLASLPDAVEDDTDDTAGEVSYEAYVQRFRTIVLGETRRRLGTPTMTQVAEALINELHLPTPDLRLGMVVHRNDETLVPRLSAANAVVVLESGTLVGLPSMQRLVGHTRFSSTATVVSYDGDTDSTPFPDPQPGDARRIRVFQRAAVSIGNRLCSEYGWCTEYSQVMRTFFDIDTNNN